MCIGLNVRGNINLSLKAITRSPGSQSNPGVKQSAAHVQRTPEVWKHVSNVHKKQKSKDDPPRSGNGSSSPIVIRSAAECDKEEKAAAPNENSKAEAPLDAKNLKLRVKLTAKVHQILAHGLVLDLGGDICGMYRFESLSK